MFDEGLLMAGVDFNIGEDVVFMHPKLEMIKNIGINNYFAFTGLFCTEPHEIMVDLYDKGIDFEETTSYEMFVDSITENYVFFNNLFILFSNIEYVIPDTKNNKIIYKTSDCEDFKDFSESLFDNICSFMRKIHVRGESKPPKFKNSAVKDIYIEIQRDERELNPAPKFSRLISSLVWCEESSYKYSEIWDLYMYQFHDGIKTVSGSKDFKTIMHGFYSGTIDKKSISNDRLNWIRS